MVQFALSCANALILTGWWIFCGLPLVRVCLVRCGLFAQVAIVGLIVHTSIFLAASALRITPRASFWYIALLILLINIFCLRSKIHLRRIRILNRECTRWMGRLCLFTVVLAFVYAVQDYCPPILFFNRSDTHVYLGLADLFWDNLPFRKWNGILNYNPALLQSFMMYELVTHRAGAWPILVPSYAAFGIQPHFFLFGLIVALWNLTAATAVNVARSILDRPVGRKLEWIFYLSPFFVFSAFEGFVSQTLFTPLFIFLVGISSRQVKLLAIRSFQAEWKEAILAGIAWCGVALFFPEYSLPTAAAIAAITAGYILRYHIKITFDRILQYLKFWLVAAITLVLLGHVGLFKSISSMIGRATQTDYYTLIDTFPGQWVNYLISMMGGPYYPTIFPYPLLNILCFVFLVWMAVVWTSANKSVLRPVAPPFVATVALLSLLSSYATVKMLAVWSAVLTPLVLISLESGKRAALIVLCLAIVVSHTAATSRSIQDTYVYSYFHDLKSVASTILERFPRSNVLFLTRRYEMNGTLALLLARHKGQIFTSDAVFGRGMVLNSKYGQNLLSSCDQIEEPVVVTADSVLGPGAAWSEWVRNCARNNVQERFGKMSLILLKR